MLRCCSLVSVFVELYVLVVVLFSWMLFGYLFLLFYHFSLKVGCAFLFVEGLVRSGLV